MLRDTASISMNKRRSAKNRIRYKQVPTYPCILFFAMEAGTYWIRLKTDFEKFPLRPLTGGNFHVKVKEVIRLTEVEMTTGSIA